jgi:hypothetical protein
MKTIQKNESSPRLAGAGLPWLSLLSLALAAPLLADDAAPPKDHALFAGATVQVEDGSGFFDIAGVEGYSVSFQADGKLRHIRRDEIRNVRVGRSLKLTDVVARIDKMIVTPTHVGPRADRFADMHMQLLMNDMAADATAGMGTAAANYAAAQGIQNAAYASSYSHNGSGAPPVPVPQADPTALNAASAGYVSNQSMVDSFGRGPADAGDDALDIRCELSTPRVMHSTYALVLTEYREANEGKSSFNVHIEPVGELGPKPRKVTFTQTGFPTGFTYGQVSVHLYSGSLELATNLSEGRVDLTADDAMRYLVLAYVTSHTKDSLAAKPLRIAVPADFRQRASAADLDRTLYAKIDTMGRVRELSAAPDQQVAVDPYIDSTVRKFYYEPAIRDGKPVESVVEVRLAGLLQ